MIRSAPYTVRADGQDQWWDPVTPTGLTEDRWIRAIEVKPEFAAPYNNLGLAYLELKRYDDALAAFREALRLDPRFSDARTNLGRLHSVLGNVPSETEAPAAGSSSGEISAQAHYDRGSRYLRGNQVDKAIEELTKGLTRSSRMMQQLLPLLLGWLSETPNPDVGLLEIPFRAAEYHAVARGAASFSEVAGMSAWGAQPALVELKGEPTAMRRVTIVGDFFGVLGARPALGRVSSSIPSR